VADLACDLHEITEEALADEIHEVGIEDDAGPFFKHIFGWVAQTAYVSVLSMPHHFCQRSYVTSQRRISWCSLICSQFPRRSRYRDYPI
jgi:hypothetical protein